MTANYLTHVVWTMLGIDPLENWLRRKPWLWRLLNDRAESGGTEFNQSTQATFLEMIESKKPQ